MCQTFDSCQGHLRTGQVSEVQEETESALPRVQADLYPQSNLPHVEWLKHQMGVFDNGLYPQKNGNLMGKMMSNQWLEWGAPGSKTDHQIGFGVCHGLYQANTRSSNTLVGLFSIAKSTYETWWKKHFSSCFQESLCGNSKTVMMAAISPNFLDYVSWRGLWWLV